MKVAVATDDYKNVTGHVGRCGGFLILKVEDGKIKSREERANVFTSHAMGKHGNEKHMHDHEYGHGRLAEALSDCQYLICQGAGWRLVEDLKSVGISPVFTKESDAENTVIKFSKGEFKSSNDSICLAH